jgi:hypothetical protein
MREQEKWRNLERKKREEGRVSESISLPSFSYSLSKEIEGEN